mmetsp:Transcript_10543/g.27022  ORF Transcript_10543/g.27022 Transcript_10543/m.27022 type:complete len:239 (-) Transcript_10543:333-1049(-)
MAAPLVQRAKERRCQAWLVPAVSSQRGGDELPELGAGEARGERHASLAGLAQPEARVLRDQAVQLLEQQDEAALRAHRIQQAPHVQDVDAALARLVHHVLPQELHQARHAQVVRRHHHLHRRGAVRVLSRLARHGAVIQQPDRVAVTACRRRQDEVQDGVEALRRDEVRQRAAVGRGAAAALAQHVKEHLARGAQHVSRRTDLLPLDNEHPVCELRIRPQLCKHVALQLSCSSLHGKH